MSKVCVASRSFSKHPLLRAELLEKYPDVTFNDDGLSLSGFDLISFVEGHEYAITALEKLDAAFFAALPKLKVISKYGVGYDMIDFDAMIKHDVKLGWTGGTNRRSVSELMISATIALLRHVPAANREVLDGIWRQHMGRYLSRRIVGIIGCGHVGKDLAPLLRAFDCKVLAHDILEFPEFYAAHDIEPVELDELLIRADVITLHLPFDDSTRNILSAERLGLMRNDAILINMARGGLVDEAALKTMLMDGRLSGAAFDVFTEEPPTDIELLRLTNFLVTPHIGGSAEEAILAMGRAAIDGLENARTPSEDWPN